MHRRHCRSIHTVFNKIFRELVSKGQALAAAPSPAAGSAQDQGHDEFSSADFRMDLETTPVNELVRVTCKWYMRYRHAHAALEGRDKEIDTQHRRCLIAALLQHLSNDEAKYQVCEVKDALHKHALYHRTGGPENGTKLLFVDYPNEEGVHVFCHSSRSQEANSCACTSLSMRYACSK